MRGGIWRELSEFYGVSDYQPLLESWGYAIKLQLDENDYQGDSFVLFRDERYSPYSLKYGILQFGWGSCSGCDALQACDSMEEVDALRTELHESIRWGTKEELYKYVTEHDWEADWSYSSAEGRAFVAACRELLKPTEY